MTNINIKCPKCDATLSVSADLPGKLVNCPLCSNQFTVPIDAVQNIPLQQLNAANEPQNSLETSGAPAGNDEMRNFTPQDHFNPSQAQSAQGGYQQGGYPQGFVPQNMIKTYLVESILATIFCCIPFGVIAVVFAAQAGNLLSMGQYQLAFKSAETAKKWALASLLTGLAMMFIYVISSLLVANQPKA